MQVGVRADSAVITRRNIFAIHYSDESFEKLRMNGESGHVLPRCDSKLEAQRDLKDHLFFRYER